MLPNTSHSIGHDYHQHLKGTASNLTPPSAQTLRWHFRSTLHSPIQRLLQHENPALGVDAESNILLSIIFGLYGVNDLPIVAGVEVGGADAEDGGAHGGALVEGDVVHRALKSGNLCVIDQGRMMCVPYLIKTTAYVL